jgi:hypothetical protein
MTYNPNVPDLPHMISNDIPEILVNSQQMNIIFGVDHVPLSPSVPTSGYHKQVRFPQVIATPVLSAGQGSVYIKTVAGRTELFYTSSSAETQITSASVSGGLPIWKAGTPGGNGVVQASIFNVGPDVMGNGNGVTTDYGNIIFPNGLEYKWGRVIPTSGDVDGKNFTYPTPFATQTINVQITGIRNSTNSHSIYIGDVGTPDVSANRFTPRSDSGLWTGGFYYFAIGN